jgi:L-methionine (R)-S-oxide reductase
MDKNKKQGRYNRIYKQLEGLLTATKDKTAKMATIAAVLHHKMDYFFWTGFYLLRDGELTVGPYQGPVACLVLKKDTGVCWAGINEKKALVVADVDQFPGHIACDSRSRSEIVIPLKNENGEIYGVMDVDSKELESFDEVDRMNLERIVGLLR